MFIYVVHYLFPHICTFLGNYIFRFHSEMVTGGLEPFLEQCF